MPLNVAPDLKKNRHLCVSVDQYSKDKNGKKGKNAPVRFASAVLLKALSFISGAPLSSFSILCIISRFDNFVNRL